MFDRDHVEGTRTFDRVDRSCVESVEYLLHLYFGRIICSYNTSKNLLIHFRGGGGLNPLIEGG